MQCIANYRKYKYYEEWPQQLLNGHFGTEMLRNIIRNLYCWSLFIIIAFILRFSGLVSFCDPDGNSLESILGVFTLPNAQIRVNVYNY